MGFPGIFGFVGESHDAGKGFYAFCGGCDFIFLGAIGTLDSTGFGTFVGIGGESYGTGNEVRIFRCVWVTLLGAVGCTDLTGFVLHATRRFWH